MSDFTAVLWRVLWACGVALAAIVAGIVGVAALVAGVVWCCL